MNFVQPYEIACIQPRARRCPADPKRGWRSNLWLDQPIEGLDETRAVRPYIRNLTV